MISHPIHFSACKLLEHIHQDFCSCNQFMLLRLDGHHVVFGKVLSGMDVVYKTEAQGRQDGMPKSRVIISDSGELPL